MLENEVSQGDRMRLRKFLPVSHLISSASEWEEEMKNVEEIIASEKYDMWSFGMVMIEMFLGKVLRFIFVLIYSNIH